ncbi:MAG: phosphatase PAP2 family protein [Proteobacteria bacterium]|nr:MAG: phosphatase PAP2 family protein [Pseudomonadota bacterium]
MRVSNNPIDLLLELDRQLLMFINRHELPGDAHTVLIALTTANTGKNFFYVAVPIVIAIFLFFFRKKGIAIVFMTAILAAVADQFNYRIVKGLMFRLRPFSAIPEVVLRVPYGPQSSSFPSNHATTTMALAVWLSYLFPKLTIPFYAVSFLIGYSRVYAGVHYPSDVIIGWIIGAIMGSLMVFAGKKLLKLHVKPDEIED